MKFYITTPIYYVNDVPHIGHSYTTIAADILARWKRLNNYDVFFLTGTDEHGAKIVQAAKEKELSPSKLCNQMSLKFRDAWKILNISYTNFIRTTEDNHAKSVENIIQTLFEQDLIFKKQYEGLYCVGCEKFYSPRDLDENSCCVLHKTPAVLQSEENYFFRLSKFENEILLRLTNPSHKEYIQILPEERRNEIIGKLKLGLEDISISRSAIDWGIPLSFDKSQTVYVWIDALINYLTGIEFPKNEFKKYWPVDVHFMAKDILWFHSVIWPAVLIGAGLELPKKIYSHGFFTINGNKMSKSLGNVISPWQLVEKYGTDAARYLTVTLIPFGQDGDISWESLTLKYNTDLANNLGNLISRTLKMSEKNFNNTVPQTMSDLSLVRQVGNTLKEDFIYNMENIALHKVSENLQCAVTLVNQQIEQDAPWKLVKTNKNKLAFCIYSYLQAIDLIAIHLLCIMPEVAQKIWYLTGASGHIQDVAKKYFNDYSIPEEGFSIVNVKLGNSEILFPRIS